MHNPKSVGVSIGPLRIIKKTPAEVSLQGDSLCGSPLHLMKMISKIENSVCIKNIAIRVNFIIAGTTILCSPAVIEK